LRILRDDNKGEGLEFKLRKPRTVNPEPGTFITEETVTTC